MASVLDAFVKFLGDFSGIQKSLGPGGEVDKAAEASGQRAGTKLGTAIGNNMSKLTAGAGAAAGLAFGIAAKGASEAEAAVADYTAATGATAEEAEIAKGSLQRLWKDNLNGFGELGTVLAMVKTDLGLTGEAGEKAAQRILDYAKATKQDAAGATADLDDLIDGLNLSYDDASVLLDQLVKSHQKYGGSVKGNAGALAELAPALNAANLSADEGLGILNLFAASGVDASAATAGLRVALTKVKSPEELKALIEDISNTKDPFERATKAADLFGARAGAKLANALDGVSFDEFIVGADEAAGSIDKASDAIDNSPLNQLKLMLKNVTGPLVTAGASFGPLILGLSQLANPAVFGAITTGMGAVVGKAVPALVGGLMGLGTVLGPIVSTVFGGLGAVATAAIALWPVLLLAAVVAAVVFLINNPELVAQIGAVVQSLLTAFIDFMGALPGLLVDLFGKALGAVAQHLPGLVIALAKIILTLPFRILHLQVKLLEFFAKIGTNILGGIAQLVANIVGFFVKLPGRIVSMLPALVGFFGQIAANLSRGVATLVDGIVRFFLGIPGRIASLGRSIVEGIINGMARLPGKIANIISNAFRNLRIDIGPFHISSSGVSIDLPKIDFPHFAVGTGMKGAHEDMLAELSYGEIVVPARESEAIRSGRAVLGRSGLSGATSVATDNGITIGSIVVQPGNDVSTAAAARFGQDVADALVSRLRVERARSAGGW